MEERWMWKYLPKVKDTEDNHLQEAKNRLNYVNWVLNNFKTLVNDQVLSIFNFAHFYDALIEEKEVLETIIRSKE